MALWNSVDLTRAAEAGRLDAEYFRKIDLQRRQEILDGSGHELGNLAKVLNGRAATYDPTGAVRVVRACDLVSRLIYPDCGSDFMRARPDSRQVALSPGDVLISSIGMGSIGKISLVVDGTALVTVPEVTVIRDGGNATEWLFGYLASEEGQRQIDREVTGGTGQQHLLKSKVEGLAIPTLQPQLGSRLAEAVRQAYSAEERARNAYAEAEGMVECVVGDLPTYEPFFERCYQTVQAGGRWDAEYFQPRMRALMSTLEQQGRTIGDVASLSRRRFRPTSGTDFEYIEISGVAGSGTAISRRVSGDEAPTRATQLVKAGDVITTTVRPIRRLSAVIGHNQDGNVCSSGFAVLTAKAIPAEVLMVYLRLPAICELLDLHTTATMYPAIAVDSLMRIPVALPPDPVIPTVVERVREALEARAEAEQWLDAIPSMVSAAVT